MVDLVYTLYDLMFLITFNLCPFDVYVIMYTYLLYMLEFLVIIHMLRVYSALLGGMSHTSH